MVGEEEEEWLRGGWRGGGGVVEGCLKVLWKEKYYFSFSFVFISLNSGFIQFFSLYFFKISKKKH